MVRKATKIETYLAQIEEQRTLLSQIDLSDYEIANLRQFNKVKEIYSSNAIEGNTFTENETAILLETGMPIVGKVLKENLEIVNLSKAIDYSDDLITFDKSIDFNNLILNMHSIAMAGLLNDPSAVGRFIQVRNLLGGPSTDTNSSQAIWLYMKELENVYETKRDSLHPIFLACIISYRFVCIHPFVDGNDRVSRLLLNYILGKYGYLSVIINPDTKHDYYKALEDSNKEKGYFKCDSYIEYICSVLLKRYRDEVENLSRD
ncbi:Fic/DOC family protein [compost metagenome]